MVACEHQDGTAVGIEILNILETFDFAKMTEEADRDHVAIEVLRLALEDRRRTSWKDDAERVSKLLFKKHARRARRVDRPGLGGAGGAGARRGGGHDPCHRGRPGRQRLRVHAVPGSPVRLGPLEDAGLLLHATQSERLSGIAKPGARHTTGQTSANLVKDRKPWMVIGSAGETRIISAVALTVHGVVDRGWSIRDAVFAPRAHWQGGSLLLEGAGRRGTREALRRRGFEGSELPTGSSWGRAQAALWDAGAKKWTGAADSRGAGTAKAPSK